MANLVRMPLHVCVCALPQVDLGYFNDDGSDLATLVSGVKIARDIAAQVRTAGGFAWLPGWESAAAGFGGCHNLSTLEMVLALYDNNKQALMGHASSCFMYFPF